MSGNTTPVDLEAGRDYLLGVTILRVAQDATPNPLLKFTSVGIDHNFTYSTYRARARWKTLNVPIDSNLPERLVSIRAYATRQT